MRRTLASLAVFLVGVLGARAAAERPQALSLPRAVALALQKNPTLAEARDDEEIAAAQLQQARSGYFPRVSLTAGSVVMEEAQKFAVPPGAISFDLASLGVPAITALIDKPVTNTDTLEIPITDQWINFGLLTVTQPLFTGGMILGYNRQARHGLRAARHGAARQRHEVIRTVVRRYNDVLLTKQLAALGEDTLTKLKVIYDITERVLAAGSQKLNKLDLLRTRMFVKSLQSFVETLRQSRALALEGLKFAIGLEAGARIAPSATEFPLAPVKRSCAQSVAQALRERPEVQQIAAGIQALDAGVGVARSRYFPDLALAGGYLIDDKSIRFTDGHSFFVGLMLNFNLFEGFMTRAKVREARARAHRLRNTQRYATRGVSLQVRKACMDVARAERQVQLTKEALRTAEEHLELSDTGYQADLVEMEDLLKAQLMEAAMRFQHVKARYDLSNHLLELRVAAGDLSAYTAEGR